MAYQVLARKWRPKIFADLVGQEHVTRALQNALTEGRLHHAYLLTGTRGVGKTTIARILAKSFNCEQVKEGEPCGICSACTQIDAGGFVDLLEIDAASNTGIDNIREVLENAQYAPTAGHFKVYIIDEVHMLSKSAFNAMLKTLEEPPEHVKFILATTDPHKVPVTVLSRCLQFVLRNMQPLQIQQHLAHVLKVEQIPFAENALSLIARAAMGSMRDALSLLDQAIALGSGSVQEADIRHMLGAVDKRYLYTLLQHLVNQDGQALVQAALALSERGVGFDNALSELAALLQQLALIQAVPNMLAEDEPERELLQTLAKVLSGEQIQLYYQCAIHGKQDLPLAPEEYAGFVMTLLRMLAFTPLAADSAGLTFMLEGSDLHDVSALDIANKIPANKVKESVTTKDEPSTVLNPQTPALKMEPQTPFITPKSQLEKLPAKVETEAMQETAHIQEMLAQELESAALPWDDEGENAAVFIESLAEDQVNESTPLITLTAEEQAAQGSFFDEESAIGTKALVEPVSIVDAVEPVSKELPVQASTLPALLAENWADIVFAIGPKLGAAQMLAQNATLVTLQDDVLILAISENALVSKEMLDRMGKVISKAYGHSYQVRTQRLGKGQETLQMQRERQHSEAQQQALQHLESDPVVQEIVSLFDAVWLPESIKPLNDTNK